MSVIYTIGYEATNIDRFIETLKIVGIKHLADVRAVAVSRKKGFSKRSLAERLDKEGIGYVHFIDLGDPKPGRDAAHAGNFDLFRSIYADQLETDAAQSALRELAAIAQELPTCLLCFERLPRDCHRSIVAREIAQEAGLGICDLFADDPDRYVRNASKMPRFHPSESAATA